jgi:hypothetical protein
MAVRAAAWQQQQRARAQRQRGHEAQARRSSTADGCGDDGARGGHAGSAWRKGGRRSVRVVRAVVEGARRRDATESNRRAGARLVHGARQRGDYRPPRSICIGDAPGTTTPPDRVIVAFPRPRRRLQARCGSRRATTRSAPSSSSCCLPPHHLHPHAHLHQPLTHSGRRTLSHRTISARTHV